jgi:hypothetical protein
VIDEIAERFHRRKEFDLVDFAEVALPMYLLTLDLLTLSRRPLAPIKEFVLRTVAAGLADKRDICGVLGLDPLVVEATINQLASDHFVDQSFPDARVSLLARGHQAIAEGREVTPEEETLTIVYDGLLRKPIWLAGEQLYRPNEIQVQRMVEIRPYPALAPEQEDLDLVEINDVLQKQYGGRDDFGRDVLCVKRIVRRVRMFRTAVGLAYKARRAQDILVSFIVDGAPDEAAEKAFAEKGGPKKMGFIKAINDSSSPARLRRHLGSEVTALLPSDEEYRQLKENVAGARLGLEIASKRLEQDQSDEQKIRFGAAEQRLTDAEAALQKHTARPLAPYERSRLFLRALSNAKTRLIISSFSISADVAGRDFLKRIERLVKQGVAVTLYLDERAVVGPGAKANSLQTGLEKLQRKHGYLNISLCKKLEFFSLIQDGNVAVISNVPWLSALGKVRTFHATNSYLLQGSDVVDAYTERLKESLTSSAAKLSKKTGFPAGAQAASDKS